MKLKPYPHYKDSGLDWLSNIPKHWELLSIRAFLKTVNLRGRPDLPILSVYRDYGIIRKDSRNDNHNRDGEDLSTYKVVNSGNLVLNKMKTWQGSLGISEYEGIVSPAYIVCKFIKNLNTKYIHYLLRSTYYITSYNRISYGVRVGQWDMRFNDFKQLPIFRPTIQEQNKIVSFLDVALWKISRFIHNKRRLVELLKEQKQAIINRAVTRGLDPNVKLKPSSEQWLGDIPQHWLKKRVKLVSKILRGKFSHRPRNNPQMYNGPYPFIQTGDVARAKKNITSYHQTLSEMGFTVSKQFPKGTLVMAIAANIGDVAILQFDACFPDSVIGFVPKNEINLDFLYYAFMAMRQELIKEAPVSTQGNLNIERVGSLFVPLPSLNEQVLIVSSIEEESTRIDSTITRAEREIELMQEYRTRLIADVVTGKVDVRDVPIGSAPDVEVLEEVDKLQEETDDTH